MTQTLTLVLTASLLAIVIGIPLGIWAAESKTVSAIVKPLIDFCRPCQPLFI